MRTLDRYVAATLYRAFALALFVLMSLFSFLAFVREMDEVGRNGYSLADAAAYVVLTLPQCALDLAPAAALFGGLLGLGALARGNEITAMLTSGVSLYRFIWAVGKAAVAFAVGCVLLSLFVAPSLQQFAETFRADSNKSIAFGSAGAGGGFWLRDSQQILHAGLPANGQIRDLFELYKIDPRGRLAQYLQAERADLRDSNRWHLVNVRQKTIVDNDILRKSYDTMAWTPFLETHRFAELLLPAKSLSPWVLYRRIVYTERIGETTAELEILFWQKVMLPLNVVAMALLAMPFGFVLLRSSVADQLMLGAAVGTLIYLLDQIVAHLGASTHLSPPLACALPLAAILALAGYLLRRVVRSGVLAARSGP